MAVQEHLEQFKYGVIVRLQYWGKRQLVGEVFSAATVCPAWRDEPDEEEEMDWDD